MFVAFYENPSFGQLVVLRLVIAYLVYNEIHTLMACWKFVGIGLFKIPLCKLEISDGGCYIIAFGKWIRGTSNHKDLG